MFARRTGTTVRCKLLQASRQSADLKVRTTVEMGGTAAVVQDFRPAPLGQRFAAELPEPDRDEQDVEKNEPDEQSLSGQVSELRHQGAAESLARVHDRVHQHGARA